MSGFRKAAWLTFSVRMRLIETSTYEHREFLDKQIPRYAILSHRWDEDGEVTLQDLDSGRGPQMSGWSKIKGCCAQAAKDGWRYCVSQVTPSGERD